MSGGRPWAGPGAGGPAGGGAADVARGADEAEARQAAPGASVQENSAGAFPGDQQPGKAGSASAGDPANAARIVNLPRPVRRFPQPALPKDIAFTA